MALRIINPVLPGFYPDPSICAANGMYYLVCSSFSYFPGLPIFRSKNGVKWEQIGNIIDRPEQMDFSGQGVSRGLFAPTIRYHEGKFYCICTQVDRIGNFFVTADDPAGPWSNPIPIPKAQGIDPSLFFDDDGSAWYVGTRPAPEGPKFNGNWEIWIQKINLENGDLLGEPLGIWRGALKDCIWPEGPHIYKIDGRYYLIHAEGGTGPEHAVMVARADSIEGPWVGKPANPILTHRHLGKGAGVVYVGHADLMQLSDGKWWMCCLGSRPFGEGNERYCNMGRETFFVPVKWEDGWPVVSWETGLVEEAYSLSGHVVKRGTEDANAVDFPVTDDFITPKLADYWLSLRSRDDRMTNCTEHSGALRLYGGAPVTADNGVNMVVRRQSAFSFEASTRFMARFIDDGDCAGLVCFQNEKFNYRLQVIRRGKISALQLVRAAGGEDEVLAEDIMTGSSSEMNIVLRVLQEKQKLKFEFGPDERNMHLLAENVDATILSYEKAGGFVGTVVGMFATSAKYAKIDGAEKPEIKADTDSFYADFEWFKCENFDHSWTYPAQ